MKTHNQAHSLGLVEFVVKEKKWQGGTISRKFRLLRQPAKWHNINREMDTVFPSNIFYVKFNSQAILRNASAFTQCWSPNNLFPVSYKKQELRFQQFCSPDVKIALKQNFIYIWSSPLSLSRDRGFIVRFLDRNGRKKFLYNKEVERSSVDFNAVKKLTEGITPRAKRYRHLKTSYTSFSLISFSFFRGTKKHLTWLDFLIESQYTLSWTIPLSAKS